MTTLEKETMIEAPPSVKRIALTLALVPVTCVSLYYASFFKYPLYFTGSEYHILYDPYWLGSAAVAAGIFSLGALGFAFARFSFGYAVGLYFYVVALGYVWLNFYSDFAYDHQLAALSAVASFICLALPLLLLRAPMRQVLPVTPASFANLVRLMLLISAATIFLGAFYGFQVVGLEDMYQYRAKLDLPVYLRYAVGISSSTLLPFAFAWFVCNRRQLQAAASLCLLVLFYPITITKLALFAPFWLVAIALITAWFEARTAVIFSLLAPISLGIFFVLLRDASHAFFYHLGARYFFLVNFRMLAVPSIAIDVYNDFFSRHPTTSFCQISLIRVFSSCPYAEPLGEIMEKAYQMGSFNASLLATEGVASLGILFAPVSAFFCGLILAIGNIASTGLSSRFIFISSAILLQSLINVPLSVVLVTHGGILLFLLWYIMPREVPGGELSVRAQS